MSDSIYDDAVTLPLMRGGSVPPAKRLGEKRRSGASYPQLYDMLRVSAAVFADAVDGFDGIVSRIDPATL